LFCEQKAELIAAAGYVELAHFGVELLLGAFIGVLYGRARRWRRELAALETDQGLTKKKFEAATAGLHIRLLSVEQRSRPLPATAAPTPQRSLSRGEMDLLMKIRRLREE
jgi:hypothetical protein